MCLLARIAVSFVVTHNLQITLICWFSVIFYFRNTILQNQGLAVPKAIKTGTTIVGITYNGGVILGADTRATEGPIVADKNCEKIHFLAKNM